MKFDTTAVTALSQQLHLPLPTVVERLTAAMTDAYARTVDAEAGASVVLDVTNGTLTVLSADGYDITPADFGRTAAATARQAVQMWIKDVERIRKVGVWAHREGTLVTGTVRAHAARNAKGEVLLDVGSGVEVVMPAGEQTPGEEYRHGDKLTVFIVAVNATDRDGVRVTVSRRQPAFVTALFTEVVPELADGSVEVVAVARDPGARCKVAVRSTVPGVSAKAALIGEGAVRIARVAGNLHGEKVDVVDAPADLAGFVAAALTPAKVSAAQVVDPARRVVTVTVAPDQYALAVGKSGANTRLAQRLTGARIEVHAAA